MSIYQLKHRVYRFWREARVGRFKLFNQRKRQRRLRRKKSKAKIIRDHYEENAGNNEKNDVIRSSEVANHEKSIEAYEPNEATREESFEYVDTINYDDGSSIIDGYQDQLIEVDIIQHNDSPNLPHNMSENISYNDASSESYSNASTDSNDKSNAQFETNNGQIKFEGIITYDKNKRISGHIDFNTS